MKFGTLAMLGFWLSALGGVLGGWLWLRARRSNPVPKQLIRESLQRRFEAGELSRADYEQRLRQLDDEATR